MSNTMGKMSLSSISSMSISTFEHILIAISVRITILNHSSKQKRMPKVIIDLYPIYIDFTLI